ncbi:MAG: ATPase, partial [Gammaproteobacteria bacterium]|nr:ATPase [Gammaproteobacteria bacterium]
PKVREEIFRIHLERRELALQYFNLPELAMLTEGYSGAEIEQAVVSALYAAQARQVDVGQQLLVEMLQRTVPLAVLMAEELTALRNWAANRTVHAG